MKKITIILCLLISACNEQNENEVTKIEKNECVSAGEAYLFKYQEISGDCGSIPDEILVVPQSGILDFGGMSCTNPPRYEGCVVFVDTVCKENDITINQTGRVEWANDGSSCSGIISISASTLGDSCFSTYQLNAIRLATKL